MLIGRARVLLSSKAPSSRSPASSADTIKNIADDVASAGSSATVCSGLAYASKPSSALTRGSLLSITSSGLSTSSADRYTRSPHSPGPVARGLRFSIANCIANGWPAVTDSGASNDATAKSAVAAASTAIRCERATPPSPPGVTTSS